MPDRRALDRYESYRLAVVNRAFRTRVLGDGVSAPVEAVAILRSLGMPAEIKARVQRLIAINEELRGWVLDPRVPTLWQGPFADIPPVLEGLHSLYEALNEAWGVAEIAEARLADAGLRYNRADDCVETVPGERGGHARRFVNAEVGRVWEALRADYRTDTGDDAFTAAPLRALIRDELASYFPPELLTDAAIKRAIEYHVKRRGDRSESG